MSALRDDVQAFLERRPVSVVNYSVAQRLAKWAGRNRRLVVAVAGTGALGLAVLLSASAVYLRDVTVARDRAESARAEALAARDQATQARDGATRARDRALVAEREAVAAAAQAELGLAMAALRLDSPRASDEPLAARVGRLLEGLALQQDWEAAADLLSVARSEGLAVPELLAARVAWKVGQREQAGASLHAFSASGRSGSDAGLDIWLRVADRQHPSP